jgi:tetratricopeptide (TPR) repeat protein
MDALGSEDPKLAGIVLAEVGKNDSLKGDAVSFQRLLIALDVMVKVKKNPTPELLQRAMAINQEMRDSPKFSEIDQALLSITEAGGLLPKTSANTGQGGAAQPQPLSPATPVQPAQAAIAPAQGLPAAPSSPATVLPSPAWQAYAAMFPESPAVRTEQVRARINGGDSRGGYELAQSEIKRGYATAENFYLRGLGADRLGDHEQGHRDASIALAIDARDARARALLKLTEGKASTIRLSAAAAELRGTAERRAAEAGAPEGDAAPAPHADPLKIIEELRRQAGADPLEASARLTRETQRLLQVQDAAAAVVVARKAVELNARNVQALNLLATAQARLGEHRLALDSVAQGLALAPQNPALLQTRAWTHNEMGDYRAAYGDTLELLRVRPDDPGAYYLQARALSGLGERDAMRQALGKAAAADPKFRPLYEQALQLPEDADTSLLFAGDAALNRAARPAAPRAKRSLRFVLLTLCGGFLFALGLLHVFSATWRERLRTTILRAAGGAAALPLDSAGPFTASSAPSPSWGGEGTAREENDLRAGFWAQYEFVRELGLGGMGVVCEAKDSALGRRVAVKKMRDEIRSDARERERFLKEARTVAALRHPNIVEIYSIVEEGPELYLVFEFAEGRTLHELLAERGSLPLPEALKVFRGVCAALEYSHAQGVVHRDLKPANIMVDEKGGVKVMDFGIARQARDAATRLTRTQDITGTPPYMAPEQEQGMVCRESDLYALGVMLYECLTGTLPFEGTAAAMLLAKMSARYMPASEREPSLPKSVDAVLAKALTPDPKDRWRVPSGLLAAIENLAA